MSLLLTAKTVLGVSLGAANLALVFFVLVGAAFAGEAHRDAFLGDPKRYVPACDGHCASPDIWDEPAAAPLRVRF